VSLVAKQVRRFIRRGYRDAADIDLSKFFDRVQHDVLMARVARKVKDDRLDQWLRRRIRMCYWKQWRRPKRRREMLIRLGVPRRQAIRHARSRKGPWHMAKTIASGVGMTNAWLHEQGLLSLKTLWATLARIR